MELFYYEMRANWRISGGNEWKINKDLLYSMGFSGGSDGKESACNVGDLGSIPGLGRSSGGGHGNPLQCYGLENPHWQRSLVSYSQWGHRESDMSERLRTAQHNCIYHRKLYSMLCCFSVTQSCPTLCNPEDHSTPGFPVLHYFWELAQTRVCWVSDAIQPSRPLSLHSLPALNLSQHQGFFQ